MFKKEKLREMLFRLIFLCIGLIIAHFGVTLFILRRFARLCGSCPPAAL
jgi:hypothetical protein